MNQEQKGMTRKPRDPSKWQYHLNQALTLANLINDLLETVSETRDGTQKAILENVEIQVNAVKNDLVNFIQTDNYERLLNDTETKVNFLFNNTP